MQDVQLILIPVRKHTRKKALKNSERHKDEKGVGIREKIKISLYLKHSDRKNLRRRPIREYVIISQKQKKQKKKRKYHE